MTPHRYSWRSPTPFAPSNRPLTQNQGRGCLNPSIRVRTLLFFVLWAFLVRRIVLSFRSVRSVRSVRFVQSAIDANGVLDSSKVSRYFDGPDSDGRHDNFGVPQNGTAVEAVEALRPITSELCCIPNKPNGNSDTNQCTGTCFTERACLDGLDGLDDFYPFSSPDEKERYPLVERKSVRTPKLFQECRSPDHLIPPMEWCQKSHEVEEVGHGSKLSRIVRDVPPAGCTHKIHGGGSGAFQYLFIFPRAKLAFCAIPKVGMTQWIQFLRFVAGAKDYLSSPHHKLDVEYFRFDRLEPKVQKEIWKDENWTFATFVRDPAERLLSAYLNKIEGNNARASRMGMHTFEKFVELLSTPFNSTSCISKTFESDDSGLTWCTDPHWRPQVFSCGISERLDRFQFVGDIQNIQTQTRELLSHVGLWESHGKHFVHEGDLTFDHSCKIKPQPSKNSTLVGFQQIGASHDNAGPDTVYGHSSGSKDKMDEYYTHELLDLVRNDLYADDYKLWKLVNQNKKMSSGNDLAAQLSSNCA